jgi:predicted aconitase with swiveling domain
MWQQLKETSLLCKNSAPHPASIWIMRALVITAAPRHIGQRTALTLSRPGAVTFLQDTCVNHPISVFIWQQKLWKRVSATTTRRSLRFSLGIVKKLPQGRYQGRIGMHTRASDQMINCHTIAPGEVQGLALLSPSDIGFYFCKPENGLGTEKEHPLYGIRLAASILIFPAGQCSSAVQTDGLHRLPMHHNAPDAPVTENLDTVLVDWISLDFSRTAHTKMPVHIDAAQGKIYL